MDILLKRGYKVRAAVRAEAKGQHLLETFKDYGNKLQLCVVGDIIKVCVDTADEKDASTDVTAPDVEWGIRRSCEGC